MSTRLSFLFISICLIATSLYAQKIVIIEVKPEKKILKPSQKVKFTASAYDVNENKVSFAAEWSATGGTINSKGWYTAGPKTGFYNIMATDSKTGVQGSASVKIEYIKGSEEVESGTKSKVTRLKLTPFSVKLGPGQKQRFIVSAFNKAGKQISPPKKLIWNVSGGSVNKKGVYKAGGAIGKFKVKVKEPNGASTEAQVTIVGKGGIITRIKISPTNKKLKPMSRHRFFATGYNSAGDVMRFTPKWKATGGWIDKKGVYYAGSAPGHYSVKAIANKVSSTATVIIEKVQVDRVELFPKGAILAPHQVQKFTLIAYDIKGKKVSIFPLWSATGGIIEADGTYKAGKIPGKYKLSVATDNYSFKADILIRTAKNPTQVKISPQNTTLNPGQTVQFKVSAFDKKGNGLPSNNLKFTVAGGAMTPKGEYTAGNKPGVYTVKVTMPGGATAKTRITIVKVVTKSVNTSTNPNQLIKWLSINPQNTQISTSDKVKFVVRGFDESGDEIPAGVSWRCIGGTISKGVFTAGSKPGVFNVTAYIGEVKVVANVIVVRGDSTTVKKTWRLKVIPPQVKLAKRHKCFFNVTLLNPKGQTVKNPKLLWKARGGTINNSGLFTAGDKIGNYWVTVEDPKRNLKTKIPVIIHREKSSIDKDSKLEIAKWVMKRTSEGMGQISIKGKVKSDNVALLKLITHREDDSSKVLYQLKIRNGQRFSIRGTYYLEDVKRVEIVLYDEQGKSIYKMQKNFKVDG